MVLTDGRSIVVGGDISVVVVGGGEVGSELGKGGYKTVVVFLGTGPAILGGTRTTRSNKTTTTGTTREDRAGSIAT